MPQLGKLCQESVLCEVDGLMLAVRGVERRQEIFPADQFLGPIVGPVVISDFHRNCAAGAGDGEQVFERGPAMDRRPVEGVSGHDKRGATPVLRGGQDGRKCGEGGYAVFGRGERADRGRIGDEDGAAGGARGDGGLEVSDDVVDDVIAPGVVGGGACDDDCVVQCGDALFRRVRVQAERRAGEGLEHGGVDVRHARGRHALVRGGDERVHGRHMTVVQQRADRGMEPVVGIAQDEVRILDEERLHG